MNNNEEKDLEDPPKTIENLKKEEDLKEKLGWGYCPVCGAKIPKIENLRFCTACGLDLQYVKEHKALPPQVGQQYGSYQPSYPQPEAAYPYPTPQYPPQYPSRFPQKMDYHPLIEKISDEEIISSRDKKLWGFWPSLLIPLGAFILMNLALVGVLVIVMLIIYDLDFIYTLINNPYFLVASTLIEIVLIILPLWYVKRYLRNPTIKNRFKLLGLTTEGYNTGSLMKEIFIGLVFAGIGLFLVAGSSIAIELIFYYIFGIEVIRSAESAPSSDVEYLISGADVLVLVLMIVIMLLVVGTTEEILFRGFMQKGLVRNLGDTWGILITAFIFAIVHLITLAFIALESPITFVVLFFLMFVPYFSVSLMLGLLYRWRNENLIAVIITHGVYNSLTILFAFLYYAFS